MKTEILRWKDFGEGFKTCRYKNLHFYFIRNRKNEAIERDHTRYGISIIVGHDYYREDLYEGYDLPQNAIESLLIPRLDRIAKEFSWGVKFEFGELPGVQSD